ncbi:MAG: UDP-N-acetylmuramate dehydrogenase [Peptoniphilaceae bacterium]|uniref:UDP-N-acetylmuramate dehydrogenase n=1 Tax=Parvimonas sp. TaxID=1944660 RepID=UPI002A76426C|nr:UDP-N-acetylmuramate dehydrogenase [Parvimonas sp.]MDD7764599.1 UDP-N-acetylmuramate dehydrogenase [Peptoniphilaceae bacterium]MDY3050575.1 UDP-N-acetylmuramate dehydrogenase [Parvimonas sp.]
MNFNNLDCNVKYDEPLKNHTTFKIGGNCKILVEPKSVDNIIEILKICKNNNLNFFIIGNGSNLLVSDNGYDGVIIKLKENFSNIYLNDGYVVSQSGATLSEVFKFSMNNSLTGFEFASGIPGTIGGAVYMNAGAYGGEMKDVVSEVEVLDIDTLEQIVLKSENLHFDYRKSIVQERNYIITKVKLKLSVGDINEIRAVYLDLKEKRNSKQPLEFGSAGSTFKRPEGNFASKLIEDSGLKGYSVNDAMVSKKHSGFIVNVGNATCSDVLKLVDYVKKTVYEKYNVKLEMEVKILGE